MESFARPFLARKLSFDLPPPFLEYEFPIGPAARVITISESSEAAAPQPLTSISALRLAKAWHSIGNYPSDTASPI
jgi:hypothetical protein